MKKALHLLVAVLSAICLQPVMADMYWVKGIDWNGEDWHSATGWVDNNKHYDWVSGYPMSGNDGDNDLCWAASASNLVTWWQTQNPEAAAAAGVPTEAEEVWQVFKDSFTDGGGYTNAGVQWWFLGDTPSDPPLKPDAAAAGYYSSLVESWVPNYLGYFMGYEDPRFYGDETDELQTLSFTLKELLQAGWGVGLHIARVTEQSEIVMGGHAITLWGLDYDEESGYLTKLYVTDSDDPQWEQEGLFELTLSPLNRKLYITEYDEPAGFSPNDFFTLTSSDLAPNGQLVYQGQYVLYGYTGLNSVIPMDLDVAPVPEPCGAMLTLFALGIATTRRRRH